MEGFILLIFFRLFWRCFNLRERVGSSDGVSKERETDRYIKKVDLVSVHLCTTAAHSLSLFLSFLTVTDFGFCFRFVNVLFSRFCLLFPEFGIYSSRTASSKREKLSNKFF